MNQKIRYLLICLAAALIIPPFHSCEEDVQVLASPEFIPVVYCLLNPADSIQTVRVSRVFQDRQQLSDWEREFDRYIGDSLNQIYLEHVGEQGDHKIWNFSFDKRIRLAGDSVFAITLLFTTPYVPDFTSDYQLYVYFHETKTMVSSKIRTLSKVRLIDPAMVPGRKMVIDPTQPYIIRWNSAAGASCFQGIFQINYLEEESDQITGKSIEMPMAVVFQYADQAVLSQNVSGTHLLQSLKTQIPFKTGVRRKLTSIDFSFYYGGTEMALFTNSGMNPKGPEGMVLDFSNFINARGMFSSISSIEVSGLSLSAASLDTIALNPITKTLNFLSSHEDF